MTVVPVDGAASAAACPTELPVSAVWLVVLGTDELLLVSVDGDSDDLTVLSVEPELPELFGPTLSLVAVLSGDLLMMLSDGAVVATVESMLPSELPTLVPAVSLLTGVGPRAVSPEAGLSEALVTVEGVLEGDDVLVTVPVSVMTSALLEVAVPEVSIAVLEVAVLAVAVLAVEVLVAVLVVAVLEVSVALTTVVGSPLLAALSAQDAAGLISATATATRAAATCRGRFRGGRAGRPAGASSERVWVIFMSRPSFVLAPVAAAFRPHAPTFAGAPSVHRPVMVTGADTASDLLFTPTTSTR
ncbi:MAG: hypothetical protein M3Z00_13020 [Actinomycetota bacterium]|nr:hypothetical protein [Actinomycetota bacterium]